MSAQKLTPIRYVFGPCRDGQHSQCMVRGGPYECSCPCNHEAQREREVQS